MFKNVLLKRLLGPFRFFEILHFNFFIENEASHRKMQLFIKSEARWIVFRIDPIVSNVSDCMVFEKIAKMCLQKNQNLLTCF